MATLHHFLAQLQQHHQQSLPLLPSRAKTRHFLNNFMAFLFPNWHEHPATAQQLEAQWNDLQSQLHDLLRPLQPTLQQPIATLIDQYFEQIPSGTINYSAMPSTFSLSIRRLIPLRRSCSAYPGFYAITVYRLVHPLVQLNVPLLPRFLSEYAHSRTGIDIHPAAVIGNPFFIDHGTGVVIGETTVIGNFVKIYQGVTLGQRWCKKNWPTPNDIPPSKMR